MNEGLRVKSLKKSRFPGEPEVFNESITERKSRFGFKTPEELEIDKKMAKYRAENEAIRRKWKEEQAIVDKQRQKQGGM
jgi:hypothetical protein